MNWEYIKKIIFTRFDEKSVHIDENEKKIKINIKDLIEFIEFLKNDNRLYFDFLASISSIDYSEFFQVHYTLCSILHHSILNVYVEISKNEKLPSLVSLYSSAEWHEREVYDMMGIEFENHPDLRRILLPNDWEGFPLLKDYKPQDIYHNIKVKY